MTRLPRLAVGSVHPDADEKPMLWAVLDVLERHGPQIQTFSSQARFDPRTGVASITGPSQRHLDSWLMNRDMCREIFLRGTQSCDLAVVEGRFEQSAGCEPAARRPLPAEETACRKAPRHAGSRDAEGRLETLCDWLDLPRIAIVDAQRISDCRVPPAPAFVDGILLDRVASIRQGIELQLNLEAIWGAPVLGRLPRMTRIRQMLQPGRKPGCPAPELYHALGDALEESLDVQRLLSLADQRKFPAPATGLFDGQCDAYRCNIAVALDDAFNCYFPDTLDLLEYRGARITDFSPLHSECLPAGTDVVYLGCGDLAAHAQGLANNYCLKQALASFAAGGGRIYAECAGMAYLCEQAVLADGRAYQMAGVLPAVAQQDPARQTASAVETTLARGCWLGREGERLRGYRNPAWQILPTGQLVSLAEGQVLGWQQVIASHLHLNFAALPEFLDRFFRPYPRPLRVTV